MPLLIVAIALIAVALAAYAYRDPARRGRRWAGSRGLTASSELPGPVANTILPFVVCWQFSSAGLVLLHLSIPPIPGRRLSRRPSRRPAAHTLLALRRPVPGEAGELLALRPTARPNSLIDLYALGYAKANPLLSFPSATVPDAFVPFAAEHTAPAHFARLPAIPDDVGLLLTPDWLILDLPPNRLAPRSLDELAAKLSSALPLIPVPSPPMISPR